MTSQSHRHIRIFLSSPGDVAYERGIAFKVLEKLSYDTFLRGKISIEVVAWDKPGADTPLLATMTPQEAINQGLPLPAQCDIVVVLFWSRMGTPLPEDYTKADGSRYLSGTEWEYENAFAAAKETGMPLLVVYRRTEQVPLFPSDPNFMAKYEQYQRVENFFSTFVNPDGSIGQGYNQYNTPEDFREAFERHIKILVKRVLDSHPKEVSPPDVDAEQVKQIEVEPWEGSPFPGLRAFTEAEEPIFFGRGRETDALLEKMRQSRFVAVVGASGSGKSSLVGAGVIPRLRANALAEAGSQDWQVVRLTPGDQPFVNLVVALSVIMPDLKMYLFDQDLTASGFAEKLEQLPSTLNKVLTDIMKEQSDWVQVLLFVDQFEELFTLTPERLREPFVKLLTQRSERLRVVVTMRADFYHRAVEIQELAETLDKGTYPLAKPSSVALHVMITRPADRAQLVFEEGLPEQIIADTGSDAGALALMAYLLDELYKQADDDDERQLTHQGYTDLGGVQGAIGRRAEDAYSVLDDEAREQLGRVFRELVAIASLDAAPTRKRAPYEQVADTDAAKHLVDALIDARLLVSNRGEQGRVVEVAHEALFRSWDSLAEWIDDTRNDIYLLDQMRKSAEQWQLSGRRRDFLWLGERNAEMQAMQARLQPSLNEIEADFARPEQAHLLEELKDIDTTHVRREAIGQRLLVIGDTRRGVGLRADGLPDIDWCYVEGGTVVVERRSFDVQPFYMSKYLITHQQFQAFMDAEDGFENELWWQELNERYHKQKVSKGMQVYANYPRDTVSWYQAMAFAKWLNGTLPADGFPPETIGDRWQTRLPLEWEWQLAATGGNPDNDYPWGAWDGRRCNTSESGIGRTVAVGMYPQGASQSGMLDLSGQLLEWCWNTYSLEIKIGSRSRRIMSGGAFHDFNRNARCMARNHDHAELGYYYNGLRVVRAVPVLP